VSAMAREVLEALAVAHPERAVRWGVEPGLTAEADPGLLRAVLENLLRNAWKFTGRRDEAHIEVGTAVHEGTSAYFVRDNGAGFDSAEAGRLFQPFQRLASSGNFPGHGVGLATVQRIVRRHGGRVWAQARRGEGATFFFTLERPARE
jgi:signal transduction histidine kinase